MLFYFSVHIDSVASTGSILTVYMNVCVLTHRFRTLIKLSVNHKVQMIDGMAAWSYLDRQNLLAHYVVLK